MELKKNLEEIKERLKKYQEKERSDKEVIKWLRELITDYQGIVEKYDSLLSKERKEHLRVLEKWKEDSENNQKINDEYNAWLKGWVENFKKKLCVDCLKKFEEPWNGKR